MKLALTLISTLILFNLFSAQCVPVADYTFSGDANDYSGNGYHATNYGATLTTDRFGNPNSAYEFNGTSDYMDTETSFDYQERTVSMWAMVYDTSVVRNVVSQDANTLNYGTFFVIFRNGNLDAAAGGETSHQIYASPELNIWHHIVLVRNASSVKMYVNGNLTYTDVSGTFGSSFNANPQMVIGTNRSKTSNFFSGKIDDIQVYDCELSQTQIDSLYNIQNNSQCLPVANYTFSGDANDYSGNGYHATNYGATLTTDRFGNPNSAFEFNGTSDYMDTETSFDYSDRTVSMWAMITDTSVVRNVVSQDANTLNYGAFFTIFRNGNLDASAGGETSHQVFTSPALNSWYHIVLVRNTSTIKVYINGNLTYTDVSGTFGSSFNPNTQMVIGTNRSKDNNFFKGKIDDIQIYNCELSAEQIDSLYGDYDVYLGQEVIETSAFKVYPNPMSENATISIEHAIDSPYNFTLLDQQGRIVKRVTTIQETQFTFSKESLARGVYYIQLAFEEETPLVQKLIIE